MRSRDSPSYPRRGLLPPRATREATKAESSESFILRLPNAREPDGDARHEAMPPGRLGLQREQVVVEKGRDGQVFPERDVEFEIEIALKAKVLGLVLMRQPVVIGEELGVEPRRLAGPEQSRGDRPGVRAVLRVRRLARLVALDRAGKDPGPHERPVV